MKFHDGKKSSIDYKTIMNNFFAGYHYWRPFFGEFHPDDFIAATDVLGKNSYIGKFIPITERRSWVRKLTFMQKFESPSIL